MKLFSRLFLILGITLTGWSSVAWGYTYACEPASSTREFSASFGTYTVTDSSKNTAGALFPDAASYNAGGYASMTCDCESGTLYDRYFWSKTSLENSGVIDGDTYYTINDNLQASIKIWVGGNINQYVPLPWTALDNERGDGNGCSGKTVSDVQTGNKGTISLRVSKPFIGSSTISSVHVVDIYVRRSATGDYGSQPIVSVYLSGSVIVPQTCQVNAGQIITVDFGSFLSGEFSTKGQMPSGYTPKTISVPIKCNGMDANADLTLSFQAEASADEPAAIKTSNDDVGVQMTDDNGNIITPNSGLIPFQLDDNLQATVTFHAAPISTTGNAPVEGTFSATAYIRVDFA